MTDEPRRMTKGDRQELSRLIRQRERIMKHQAAERSAAMLADFDMSSAQIYHYDQDEIWKACQKEAEAAVADAQLQIANRCKTLGIPSEFAPGLQLFWHGRGRNALADHRGELRRAAKSRIEAIEAECVRKIEQLSLQAQTEVVASGLESAAAMDFLNSMPALDKLMPPIQIGEIQALIESRHQEKQARYLLQ